MPLYCAFLAYVVLTGALYRSVWGTYDDDALTMVVVSLVIALIGLLLSGRFAAKPPWTRLLTVLLGGFVVVQLVLLWQTPTSPYRPDEHLPWAAAAGLAVIGVVVVSYAWGGMPGGRWRFPIVLAAYFAIGAWLIRTWPTPGIDVWHLQQGAAAELVAGRNPYAAEYPNPYQDDRFFGPGVVQNGKIQSFPYPPLNVLLDVPGYFLRDVRWSLLIAILASAGFMVAAGRRLGLPAGHPAELAAIAILCHPRGFYVLEMAWTEPFQAMLTTASLWALAGRSQIVSMLALAGALSVKQYGVLWLPAAWTSGRLRYLVIAAAIALSVLLVAPFLAWDPAGFWRGVVRFHLVSPFRVDSLSIPAGVYRNTLERWPAWVGFLAAAVTIAIVLCQRVRTMTHAALGAAVTYFAFFAFNKAAHMNYYWFVDSLLALTMITAAAESSKTVEAGVHPAEKGSLQASA